MLWIFRHYTCTLSRFDLNLASIFEIRLPSERPVWTARTDGGLKTRWTGFFLLQSPDRTETCLSYLRTLLMTQRISLGMLHSLYMNPRSQYTRVVCLLDSREPEPMSYLNFDILTNSWSCIQIWNCRKAMADHSHRSSRRHSQSMSQSIATVKCSRRCR